MKRQSHASVRKAVVLVAGYGTRFLPATKALPKEMLPVIDTPGVQFVVEEAVAAGIRDIIFVTGSGKGAIEDHFDSHPELERTLQERKKHDLLKSIRRIQRLANILYVRQPAPLGNGHATLMAEAAVGDEPFLLLYPDDLIVGPKNSIQSMVDAYDEYHAPIMGLIRVSKRDIPKYGIAKTTPLGRNVHEILGIVEKPTISAAPSNLASIKGYVLPPEIFGILRKTKRAKNGELQLIDAVGLYNKRHAVFGCELSGELYDLGSKLGWLKANIAFGLRHPEIGPELRRYLKITLRRL